MSKVQEFNTKLGYDFGKKEFIKIGNKKEWEYIGKEDGKSKWMRSPKFPAAKKAEGTRNYVCCPALCYALVVNQGPVNAWFFSRYTIIRNYDSDTACSTQNLISNLPRMDQSELINAAKEILSKFLNNNNGGKNEFDVETAEIDVEIRNSGVVPSITITHKNQSKSKTYVEIRVRDEIHHNSETWGFYESDNPDTGKPWMNQLVPLHFKGKEVGVKYDISELPTEILDQFKRRFKDRLNVSKVWEQCRDLIHHREVDAAAKKLAEEKAAAANKLAEEEAAAAKKLAEEKAAAAKKAADATAAKSKKKRIEIYNRLLEIKKCWIHPIMLINKESEESLKSLSRDKKFPSNEDKEILNNISSFIYHYNTEIIEWRDGKISFDQLKELISHPINAKSLKDRVSVRLIINRNSSEETLENLLIGVEPSFTELKDEKDENDRKSREKAAVKRKNKKRVKEEKKRLSDELERFNFVYDVLKQEDRRKELNWNVIPQIKTNLKKSLVKAEDALKECVRKRTSERRILQLAGLVRDINEYIQTTTDLERKKEIWFRLKEEIFKKYGPDINNIESDKFWLNFTNTNKKATLDLTHKLMLGLENELLEVLNFEDQWEIDFIRLLQSHQNLELLGKMPKFPDEQIKRQIFMIRESDLIRRIDVTMSDIR